MFLIFNLQFTAAVPTASKRVFFVYLLLSYSLTMGAEQNI